jgi:predicted nucleic acid-binding protein
MMPADAFFDTNVLLAATAPGRPHHAAALRELQLGVAHRTVLLSGQVVREYLAVATRPAAANGLGLTRADALANVGQIVERAVLLDDDAVVREALLRLLREVECTGRQVHDANIAATMLANGVRRLLTLNPADFRRFGDRIEIVELA